VNRKITYGVLWTLTISLSFYFGFLSRDPFDPIQRKVLEDSLRREIQDEELDALLEKLSEGPQKQRSGEEDMVIVGEVEAQPIELNFLPTELERVGKEPLTGDRIREVLAPALVSDDLVGRNAVIADMLARLTPENAGDALRVFEEMPSSYHTDNNYRLFLHAWAKVDGASALNYLMDNPNAHRVEGGHIWAMSGWTATNPQAAYDFVMSRDKVDPGLYHGLVRGWGRIDLEGAHQFVSSIEEPRLRARMTDVVGESVVEQRGIQGALDWLGQLDKKQVNMQSAYNSVIKRAIPRSSSSLAEWINRNPDNNHIQPWMYSETAKRIASRDPGLAASWLESHLTNKKVNGQVVGEVASRWVESDPQAAASWVDSLKGTRVYDKELTKRLGGAWARKDPEAAFQWAKGLETDLWRPASASIVGNMSREQLLENASWIKESPAESANDGVRAAYAMRMAEVDPYDAIEQALLMTDALGREKVTVHVAKKIFKKNPEGIRDWLPQSGLSEASQQRILRNQ
jgi:hypothetical protein